MNKQNKLCEKKYLPYLNNQIYWIGRRDKFWVIKKIEKMKGTTTFKLILK